MATFLNTPEGAHLIGTDEELKKGLSKEEMQHLRTVGFLKATSPVKKQPAVEQPPLPEDPNPKIGKVFPLAKGPERGVPLYKEFIAEDGSTAQRFRCEKGSVVIRRTCAPEERCRMRYWTWWEVEFNL